MFAILRALDRLVNWWAIRTFEGRLTPTEPSSFRRLVKSNSYRDVRAIILLSREEAERRATEPSRHGICP
jgi:hypothetical protein